MKCKSWLVLISPFLTTYGRDDGGRITATISGEQGCAQGCSGD